MNPVSHSSNNTILKAPESIPDCVDLAATITPDPAGGLVSVLSFWRPTEEELKLLNSGGLVALAVYGGQHPPVWVNAVPEDKVN